MRYNSQKTVGGALAVLGLVSTLAIAQSKSPSWRYTMPSQVQAQQQARTRQLAMTQSMTCTKVDANGDCVEAQGHDGKTIVIQIEDVKVGELLSCAPSGVTIACTKATPMK